MRRLLVTAAVLALIVACDTTSDLGESCDRPGGGPGVCENGTVCGRPSEKAGGFSCILLCDKDKDCPPGADCKGVEATSVKGCRFKD